MYNWTNNRLYFTRYLTYSIIYALIDFLLLLLHLRNNIHRHYNTCLSAIHFTHIWYFMNHTLVTFESTVALEGLYVKMCSKSRITNNRLWKNLFKVSIRKLWRRWSSVENNKQITQKQVRRRVFLKIKFLLLQLIFCVVTVKSRFLFALNGFCVWIKR